MEPFAGRRENKFSWNVNASYRLTVQRNNLEIVMIKAEFALLTASLASEEILICEKPKIISVILGGFHVSTCSCSSKTQILLKFKGRKGCKRQSHHLSLQLACQH